MADLYHILLDTMEATAVVALMVGTSMAMAYVMSLAEIPQIIGDWVQSVSSNRIVALLLINVVLLLMGTFLYIHAGHPDLHPDLSAGTGRAGPWIPCISESILVFNLCLGIVSPPTGSALFIGCAIAKVSIEQVTRPLIPLFAASTVALLVVTYVPGLSLWLPRLFGLMN